MELEKKTVAILAIVFVAILLITALLTGFFGILTPSSNSLISVSSVNIQPGGSIQNSYVINTYWDIALTLNSFQTVAALSLGPSNSSTYNGQTVTPTSQVFLTLTPGQPYESVNLIPVQSGNGFSNPIVPQRCGTGSPITVNFGVGYTGTAICTNSLNQEFYVPAQQYWTFHYPVTISVEVTGQNSFSVSKTVDILHLPANTITLSNPSSPDQNITINNLGALQGNIGQTDVGNLLFYQSGSKCGTNNWCGFGSPSSDAQSAVGQYANYWFGSDPNFVSSGSPNTGVGGPETSYYDSSCQSPPGWGQVYTYTNSFAGNTGYSYFYYPIQPSITQQTSATNSTVNLGSTLGYTSYAKTNSCFGNDLTDYLYSHTTAFANPYDSALGYTIYPNDTLSVPLPNQDVSSVLTPAITVLISTSMANTIVYQLNNALFKLSNVKATQSSIQAGASTTITGTITNTGQIPGTPQLGYSGNSLFDFSAISLQTLSPGRSEPFSITVTGINTLLSAKNIISISVQNDAGQVTDSTTITLTDTPAPSLGSSSFTITGITGPHTVAVGSQATLEVSIEQNGASGIAYLSAQSENTQIGIVSPSTNNASIGAQNTEQFAFSVAGVNAGNTTIYFAVSNGAGQTSTSQYSITVSGNCVLSCGPPTTGLSIIPIIAIVGIVAIIGAGIFIYRRR